MARRDDKANRAHSYNVFAVHKVTKKFFGGKKKGTQVGYSELKYLKAAMRLAEVEFRDYEFKRLSFDGNGRSYVDTFYVSESFDFEPKNGLQEDTNG